MFFLLKICSYCYYGCRCDNGTFFDFFLQFSITFLIQQIFIDKGRKMKYSTFVLIIICIVLLIKSYKTNKLIQIINKNKIENTIRK